MIPNIEQLETELVETKEVLSDTRLLSLQLAMELLEYKNKYIEALEELLEGETLE